MEGLCGRRWLLCSQYLVREGCEVAAVQSVSREGGGVRWWVDLHNLHNILYFNARSAVFTDHLNVATRPCSLPVTYGCSDFATNNMA